MSQKRFHYNAKGSVLNEVGFLNSVMRIIEKETSNSVMGSLKSLHQGDDISTGSQRVLREDWEFVRFIRWSGHSRQKEENVCNHPDIKSHEMHKEAIHVAWRQST